MTPSELAMGACSHPTCGEPAVTRANNTGACLAHISWAMHEVFAPVRSVRAHLVTREPDDARVANMLLEASHLARAAGFLVRPVHAHLAEECEALAVAAEELAWSVPDVYEALRAQEAD